MKRLTLVIISLLFSFTLSGCYLDDISDMEYGTPSEEELARHEIWETYYDHDQIYLDANLYDTENIDWIEVLKQSPGFRSVYNEMGEYNFLISVYVNKRQNLDLGYYRIQLHYSDISTGYGTSYEVPIIDYAKEYDTIYNSFFSVTVGGKELRLDTTMDESVKITYLDQISFEEIDSNPFTFPLESGDLIITKKPMGYEIEVDNEIFFVYDMEIFD